MAPFADKEWIRVDETQALPVIPAAPPPKHYRKT